MSTVHLANLQCLKASLLIIFSDLSDNETSKFHGTLNQLGIKEKGVILA